MKAQSGAINPTTERAAQPRLLDLPPERQIRTRCELEAAINAACALLELLPTQLAAEMRQGELNWHEPLWLVGLHALASQASDDLAEIHRRHDAEVRRLQYLDPKPFKPAQS